MPNLPREATPTTPLDIILTQMHRRYEAKDYNGAIALARIALPYLHPKVQASTTPADLASMTDEELDQLRTQD